MKIQCKAEDRFLGTFLYKKIAAYRKKRIEDPREEAVSEEPEKEPIIEDLKEKSITGDPKNDCITDNPFFNDHKENPAITEDPQELQDSPLSNFWAGKYVFCLCADGI